MSTNRIIGIENSENGPVRDIKPKSDFNKRWFALTLAFLFLAGGVTGGVYYFLWKKKQTGEKSRLSSLPDVEESESRKLNPDSLPDSDELKKAVDLYRKGYLKPAQSALQQILESSAENKVKSYALVYLGILADDEGKFNLALDMFSRAISLDEENFYAHYNMAIALRHKGMYREAMLSLDRARKLRPELVEPAILKGELQYRSNDLNAAEETLLSAAGNSRDPLAYYNLGMVYKKAGKFAEAKTAFLSALDYAAAGEVAYKSAAQLGIIHATQGDLPNAKYYLERSISLSPENPKYYYNLALVLYRMGETENAARRLSQAAGLGDQNPETFLYIARLYNELGRPQMAATSLRKAQEMAPQNVLVLNELADHLVENSEWSEAVSILKRILELSSETMARKNALFNLGRVYLSIRDLPAAETSLTRAYELDRTDEETLVLLAEVHRRRGENHKAVTLYKEGLKLNPDNLKLLKAQGELYRDLGLLTEAEESFRKLAEHPLHTEDDVHTAWQFLGDLAKSQKKYDIALSYFQKLEESGNAEQKFFGSLASADTILAAGSPASSALPKIETSIALKPDSEEARILLARILMKIGDPSSVERAEEELTGLISWSKKPALTSRVFTLRGILFYRSGMYRRAVDDFNRALELDPANQEAFENRRTAASRLN
ncbi:MAG: tetratricopeptide repeat protein [Leptospiraceae bacterium]|nr:tetratricopeptide repeat protein [Leptospiraceae bacterium]